MELANVADEGQNWECWGGPLLAGRQSRRPNSQMGVLGDAKQRATRKKKISNLGYP